MSQAQLDNERPTQDSILRSLLTGFSAEENKRLADDDNFALKSVSLVLTSIVVAGLLLMIGTVLLSL